MLEGERSAWGWELKEAIVEFPNCNRPIRIPAILSQTKPSSQHNMIENVLAPGIQINDLLLTPPIFKIFGVAELRHEFK